MANLENIKNLIDAAIQNELRYEKDNITSDGWTFLEEKAPDLVLAKIDSDDYETITADEIESLLQDVIYEYEQTHANIRYYES